MMHPQQSPNYYDGTSTHHQESEERGPIYNSTITKKGWALRAYFAVVVVMVVTAMVYCLVEAVREQLPVLVLLIVNMTLSSVMGIVLVKWYRMDLLSDDKLWYLLLLGMLIIFQCITADIFVEHAKDVYQTSTWYPTAAAPTTPSHSTATPTTPSPSPANVTHLYN